MNGCVGKVRVPHADALQDQPAAVRKGQAAAIVGGRRGTRFQDQHRQPGAGQRCGGSRSHRTAADDDQVVHADEA